jgi:hypothetical protein
MLLGNASDPAGDNRKVLSKDTSSNMACIAGYFAFKHHL